MQKADVPYLFQQARHVAFLSKELLTASIPFCSTTVLFLQLVNTSLFIFVQLVRQNTLKKFNECLQQLT